MFRTKLTIKECLDEYNEAYLILVCPDGDLICSDIHTSDYFLNSDDPDSYTTDFNYQFPSSKSAQNYYMRNYKEIYVYVEERERDEVFDKLQKEVL